jgi:hypothetical protein
VLKKAIHRAQHLIHLAKQRIAEIDRTLDRMRGIEEAIQQAQIAKEGIQEPLLFTRYQTAINRHLYDALERLEGMKERRNGDSMGSFGQDI